MDDLRVYLSVLTRRLRLWLALAALVAAGPVILALTLPPTYVSQMRLVIGAPPVPDMASGADPARPVLEQLQIIEQRLMTRDTLLDVARRLDVLPGLDTLGPDRIVAAMRSRTTIELPKARHALPMMTVGFEAATPAQAFAVTTAYLEVIRRDDAEARRGRAGAARDLLRAEVRRLRAERDQQDRRIAGLRAAHGDALPETLDLRLAQHARLDDQITRLGAEIDALRHDRDRIIAPYLPSDATGAAAPEAARAGMPRVLRTQTADIAARLATLEDQRTAILAERDRLSDSIDRTRDMASTLDTLERRQNAIAAQHDAAADRLARALNETPLPTLSVIEAPSLPDSPTGPDRRLIAMGGIALGLSVGLGVVVLLEALGKTLHRPADLERGLGIRPFATVPELRSTGPWVSRIGAAMAAGLRVSALRPAARSAARQTAGPADAITEGAQG